MSYPRMSSAGSAARSPLLALLGLVILLTLPSIGQPARAPEYHVKAAFLMRFVDYTTWPSNAFASDDSPLLIAVLGDNPFGDNLEKTVQAHKGGRPVQVRHVQTPAEAAQCHVVFISMRETDNEAAWLAALSGKPILTVGESTESLNRGGIVEFVKQGATLRFDVHWRHMETVGLKISSGMLKHARKVADPPGPAT